MDIKYHLREYQLLYIIGIVIGLVVVSMTLYGLYHLEHSEYYNPPCMKEIMWGEFSTSAWIEFANSHVLEIYTLEVNDYSTVLVEYSCKGNKSG